MIKDTKQIPHAHDQYSGKIEIIKCPIDGRQCRSHVDHINKIFQVSNEYQHNKEYQLSIHSLKLAFKKTYELEETSCSQCAQVFRSTIIDSLENIHVELKRMSSGFFKKNHYKGSFLFAQNTLKALRQNP